MIKGLVKRLVLGADPNSASSGHFLASLTPEEKEICGLVEGFTMTSVERVVSLIDAVRYVVGNRISGDVVECGVWRGGSMMVIAETLKRLGDTSRDLYLYDTFEGMTAPTGKDTQFDGKPAAELFEEITAENGAWCDAGIDEVSRNLSRTQYPDSRIKLIEGKVEETIPSIIPHEIALLRLDTDWYESTLHELEHLYPRLVSGGVLVIDDYGHWQGAKAATDEYFSRVPGRKPFLHRIDYTGRLVIKP
jgi:O-methyltransferase